MGRERGPFMMKMRKPPLCGARLLARQVVDAVHEITAILDQLLQAEAQGEDAAGILGGKSLDHGISPHRVHLRPIVAQRAFQAIEAR